MAKHGTFAWNELMTRDLAGAKEFYGTLLGWTSRDMEMGESGSYTIFRQDDEDVAGMMAMQGPELAGVPPHWLPYISVDDVDAAALRTAALGGEIKHGPTDVPGVGRFCVIADPSGAVVALMTPAVQDEA